LLIQVGKNIHYKTLWVFRSLSFA